MLAIKAAIRRVTTRFALWALGWSVYLYLGASADPDEYGRRLHAIELGLSGAREEVNR